MNIILPGETIPISTTTFLTPSFSPHLPIDPSQEDQIAPQAHQFMIDPTHDQLTSTHAGQFISKTKNDCLFMGIQQIKHKYIP